MAVEEEGNLDGATDREAELSLVLGWLGAGDRDEYTVLKDLLGVAAGWAWMAGEVPGVECGVAEVSEDGAVVLIATGLEVVVLETGALVLGGEAAGDDLDLVDGFKRDDVEDGAVVTLLALGGDGKAVDVELAEALALCRR